MLYKAVFAAEGSSTALAEAVSVLESIHWQSTANSPQVARRKGKQVTPCTNGWILYQKWQYLVILKEEEELVSKLQA